MLINTKNGCNRKVFQLFSDHLNKFIKRIGKTTIKASRFESTEKVASIKTTKKNKDL